MANERNLRVLGSIGSPCTLFGACEACAGMPGCTGREALLA